jgi:hypothetical protein
MSIIHINNCQLTHNRDHLSLIDTVSTNNDNESSDYDDCINDVNHNPFLTPTSRDDSEGDN